MPKTKEAPVTVDGNVICLAPERMEVNKLYPVEFKGRDVGFTKDEHDKITMYNLNED